LQFSPAPEARRWRRDGDRVREFRQAVAESDSHRGRRAETGDGESAMTPPTMINPFDGDRHAIWEMLIVRDSEAFVAQDWSMIEKDFDTNNFEGIRCASSTNPDEWRIVFPRLSDYRDAWLAAAREFAGKQFVDRSPLEALMSRCRLEQIDI